MNNQTNENIDNLFELLSSSYYNRSRDLTVPAAGSTTRTIPVPSTSAARTTTTPASTTTTTRTVPSSRSHYNERHISYMNMINTLREVMLGYNTNMRLFLESINSMQQSINMVIEEQQNVQPTQIPVPPPTQAPVPPPTPAPTPQTQQRFFPRNATNFAGVPLRRFNVDLLTQLYNTQPMYDVIVRPTTEQLNAALETITFHAQENRTSTCPITLEEFVEGETVTRIRHCGHIFNTQSINNWFNRRVRCPVCRYDIRDYITIDASTSTTDNSTSTTDNSTSTTDNSNNVRPNNEASTTEDTLNGLSNDITSIISNYFATTRLISADVSNSVVYRFDIPIVATYEETETDTDTEEE
jgi:hypothetical protein